MTYKSFQSTKARALRIGSPAEGVARDSHLAMLGVEVSKIQQQDRKLLMPAGRHV